MTYKVGLRWLPAHSSVEECAESYTIQSEAEDLELNADDGRSYSSLEETEARLPAPFPFYSIQLQAYWLLPPTPRVFCFQ